MARKSDDTSRGFSDIIGVVLLAVALLLLVAQVSFSRCDLPSLCNPPNKPVHNWVGPFGTEGLTGSRVGADGVNSLETAVGCGKVPA